MSDSLTLPEGNHDYSRLQREFEDEPRLTLGSRGPNFNNFPALGLRVIDDEAGQKTVLVPSTEAINAFVEGCNPGGFTLRDVSGYERAEGLLTLYANKQLPISEDAATNLKVYGYNWFEFTRGDREGISRSPRAHDLLDHVGMVAIPAAEANKVAAVASRVLTLHEGNQQLREGIQRPIANALDLLLMGLSMYAITSAHAEPGSEEARYKDWVKEGMSRIISEVDSILYTTLFDVYVKELDLGAWLKGIEDNPGVETPDPLIEKMKAGGLLLEFDWDAIDKSVARIQELPAGSPAELKRQLGSMASAAQV